MSLVLAMGKRRSTSGKREKGVKEKRKGCQRKGCQVPISSARGSGRIPEWVECGEWMLARSSTTS